MQKKFQLPKLDNQLEYHDQELNNIQENFIQYMENYKFLEASRFIQHEFKSWFCDKWIEEHKNEIQQGNKDTINQGLYILHQLLTMLNPFCPFITQEKFLIIFIN